MEIDPKHIDEVFIKRFETFEVTPPEGIWERILSSLPSNSSGTLFSNPVSLATIAAMVLITLILGLNIIHQPNGAPTSKKQPIITDKAPGTPENIVKTITQASQTPITLPPEQSGTFGKQYEDITISQPAKKSIPYKATKIRFTEDLTQKQNEKQGIDQGEKRDVATPVYFDRDKCRNRIPSQWIFGFYFTPEIIFYPEDNIQNQSGYHFDLSAALQYTDFFIESGVGLNFSKDKGAYNLDYEKYLGTYNDVYEVTFDSTENGIVPIYHTHPVDVYDSIKEIYEPTNNRYTYLEIPLFLGIRKQINRLSYFFKAGPTFSVLIHKNIPDVNLDEKDKIIKFDKDQPTRVNTNWQFQLCAGINYRLNKNINLSFEPIFRYYIKSAYERRYITSRHPYAIGLRAGILLNF